MKTIADRIKTLRLEKRMSQDALAVAVGVSRVAVTKWESGLTENMKLENLNSLCRIFGTSYEYLIEGKTTVVAIQANKTPDEPKKSLAEQGILECIAGMSEADKNTIHRVVLAEARHIQADESKANIAA